MDSDLHAAIRLTQDTLGSIVKQPRLTAKLLERPPFKFIYDIVTELTRITGFGGDALRDINSMEMSNPV